MYIRPVWPSCIRSPSGVSPDVEPVDTPIAVFIHLFPSAFLHDPLNDGRRQGRAETDPLRIARGVVASTIRRHDCDGDDVARWLGDVIPPFREPFVLVPYNLKSVLDRV